MNMKMIAGACLCATAIVGCVSLEERLASTDPAVRKEAEQDLLSRQNYVLDAKARMDAVKRVQDEEVLCNFAMTISDPQSERYQDRRPEAIAAIDKISKDELLSKVAIEGTSMQVRNVALDKIRDAELKDKTKAELKRRIEQKKEAAWVRIRELKKPNAYYESYEIYRRADLADQYNYVTDDKVRQIISTLGTIDLSDEDNSMKCIIEFSCLPNPRVSNEVKQLYAQIAKSVANVKDPAKIKKMSEAWRKRSMRSEFENVSEALSVARAKYYTDPKDIEGLLTEDYDVSRNENLRQIVFAKIEDPQLAFALANKGVRGSVEIIEKMANSITDEKEFEKYVLKVQPISDKLYDEGKAMSKRLVDRIKNQDALVETALFADNYMIQLAAEKRLDPMAYANGVAKMIKNGRIKESRAEGLVKNLKDDQATVELYDSITNAAIKSVAFEKLPEKDRKTIRLRNRAACEKRIADAKAKAKDTFELGGFYLGMSISEVDDLVGYYCPEWSNSEDYVDDGKTIRGLWVPQQKGAFCRAGKDGKVFEFNFGKNFLKNFYKFDVQNEREWAAAYSRKEGVDLRYVHLNEDVKVVDYNDPGVPYHALYSQDTYTHKNNSKDYRITYFGEQKISAGNGLVKQEARLKMQYVGGQQGMLRVRIEKD